MSWVRAIAAVFLWVIIPGTGWGADMRLGLAGSAEFDDNVVRSGADKKSDVVFRITPKVQLIEDEGSFHWDLSYRVPWEKAIQTDRVDGFRHLLNAGASYQVSGQTKLFFNDAFTRSDAVGRFGGIDGTGVAPTLGTSREPVNRNNATLGVQHSFTPRLMGNLAFSQRLFDSDIPRRSNSMVYGANTNLVYAVSSRHQLGGGAAGTYQDFKESRDGTIPSSQSLFLNVYGTWTWTIDETLTFEMTLGPTFVDNSQDEAPTELSRLVVPYVVTQTGVSAYDYTTCLPSVNGEHVLENCSRRLPATSGEQTAIEGLGSHLVTHGAGGGPASTSDSSWTYFGEAKLSKRWSPRLLSTFTYRRSESTASGAGSSTLDLVSFLTTWQISELWNAGLRADFTRRESASPAAETFTVVQPSSVNPLFAETVSLTARLSDRALDTKRWGVSVRMARRLSKHLRASLRYAYNEQTSKSGTAGSSSDFSNHLVTVGVQYDFDRWHLW